MITLKNIGYLAIGAVAVYSYHLYSPKIIEKIEEKIVFVHIEEIPAPDPVPIIPVAVTPLDEIYPWDNSAKTLLDCDKERQSDRVALACNIYHEARGESDRGQIAVALVTQNRVKSSKFPNTFAKVVWEIRRSTSTNRRVAQFSWALDGKPDKVRDAEAWMKAWEIAGMVVLGGIDDFTSGALWYHTKAVKPIWRKKLTVAMVIDDHVFYTN